MEDEGSYTSLKGLPWSPMRRMDKLMSIAQAVPRVLPAAVPFCVQVEG